MTSFTAEEAVQTVNQDLDEELTLSVMVSSTCDLSETDDENREENNVPTDLPESPTLELEMEEQGLLYFGGYIVKKFLQYSFLIRIVELNDKT